MAFTLWLTGLPSSGKTTIAKELLKVIDAQHLDGDVIRKALTKDLGFSIKDRTENIRRVSIVCNLLNSAEKNVVATFISPTGKIRNMAKEHIKPYPFILIYVKCSLEECIRRDVKGMYARALKGEIKQFTGISAPYVEPKNPDLIVDAENWTLDKCVSEIRRLLERKGLIKSQFTFFIGRWSPPHKGHKYLWDSVLNNGGKVCIAIRDTPVTPKNPLTVEQRKFLLRKLYPNNPNVKVIVIPDINEVCVGRRVGYRIMSVPEKIRTISATKIRKGQSLDVPDEIRDDVIKMLKKGKDLNKVML